MVDDLPSKPDVSGFILLFFCEPIARKAVREGVVVAAAKKRGSGSRNCLVCSASRSSAGPVEWNRGKHRCTGIINDAGSERRHL